MKSKFGDAGPALSGLGTRPLNTSPFLCIQLGSSTTFLHFLLFDPSAPLRGICSK